jgi:hypothetical protein
MARRAKKGVTALEGLTDRAEKVRIQANKRFRRVRRRTEKALEDGWEALLKRLPTRTRRTMRDAEKRLRKATAELDRRRARAVKTAEKRGRDLLDRVESEAIEAVKPLAKRLDFASKSDVERLSHRVSRLERRVERGRGRHVAAA